MAARKAVGKRTFRSVMAELKKAGTAQNRKIYARHGVSGEMYGVPYSKLRPLSQSIKQDHELALQLWASGNHDARALATMIADPTQLTGKELEAWVKTLDNYVISDAFVKVASGSPHAHKKAEAWRKKTTKEWTCRAGWMLVASIASRNDPADAAWLKSLIPVIRDNIHDSKNRIKDAMNYALISIGGTHDNLSKPALVAADKMGFVEVDHGETGCKTRPAREYIEAMLARKKSKKATKKAAGKKVVKKKARAKKTAKKTARKPATRRT